MEAFGLWLLKKLGGRAILRWARMIVGWLLGAQYRSLRGDLAALERNPGNGEVAARLIARVPPFEKAVSIFNDFKLAPRHIAKVSPYVAMVNRLQTEGMTPATVEYLKCENNEYAYEWAITEMIDEAAKVVPDLPTVVGREAIKKMNALRYPKDEDGKEQNGRR